MQGMGHIMLDCMYSMLYLCAREEVLMTSSSLETPWVEELIAKFDHIAKENGSIVCFALFRRVPCKLIVSDHPDHRISTF